MADKLSNPLRIAYDLPLKEAKDWGLYISTSRGVMTGRQAAEAGVGGEVLCNVW